MVGLKRNDRRPAVSLPSWRGVSRALIGASLLGALAAACTAPHVQQAEQYAQQGRWDEAVAAYREALKQDPLDDNLNRWLGMAKARAAEDHYAKGRRSLGQKDLLDATREFKLALGLDPSRKEYGLAFAEVMRMKEARDQQAAAEKLRSLGRFDEALEASKRAVELDPDFEEGLRGVTAIVTEQLSARMHGHADQPVTLRFQNAKLKEVFEILGRTGGVNVIFDKEVQDSPVTAFIKQMPFEDALKLILTTNGLTSLHISRDTMLIMPNSKQKLAQYQDLQMRTFYLSNAKAKDAVNLLRTMLESKKLFVDEKVNAIVIREEPAKVQLAERLIQSIDRHDSEVELDLEVLEIDRTKNMKYGASYGKQAGAGVVPPGVTSVPSGSSTFSYQQLTSIGPQSYLFLLPTSVTIDFFKQDSSARTLAAPKLRVLNNKSATIAVGDKQPILLSTTNVLPGQAATGAVPTTSTVTSIEFKDTGVKLTIEPAVNLTGEIAMKLKVEVTRLGDPVILQASPEIKQFRFGTRSAETMLLVKDEETVVLGGLLQTEERKTKVTVPWLDGIPILGDLLSSFTRDTVTTEVVLTITPRIIRNLAPPSYDRQAYWSGTESNYSTTPMFSSAIATPVSQPLPKLPRTNPTESGKKDGGSGAPSAGVTSTPSAAKGEVVAGLPPRVDATASADPNFRAMGTLTLRPGESSAVLGQEVQLDLSAIGMEAFAESTLTLKYDPKLLEFRRATLDDSFQQQTDGAGMSVTDDNASGRVSLHVVGQNHQGGGNGLWAKVVFRAKAAGGAPIKIEAAKIHDVNGQVFDASSEGVLVVVK